MTHPAQRFRAPSSIQAGSPLKCLLDRTAVLLIAESLVTAVRGFAEADFIRAACSGLDDLELKPRAAHIAAAMAAHLDRDQLVAARQLVASLGPELPATSGMGLQPFFYLPHSAFIHDRLVEWDAGMIASLALTTRFTAEFAIRPFLIREQTRTLQRLSACAGHVNPHVRRLVTEGTRPRLPWAERIPGLVRDPTPVLPLLDRLVDDTELYVRRSVANHVGDIAKGHPDIAFALCRRWLEQPSDGRRWVVRHAVRHPAKRGVAEALRLRRLAGGRGDG